MRNRDIVQCVVLPLAALLFAAWGCGGDDGEDARPGGNGARVDAAPADDMPPVDAGMTGSCVGESSACDTAFGTFTCDAQVGCDVDAECLGDEFFYCGNLSEAACQEVGCTWTSECEGSGLCFERTNELDCIQQVGCFWNNFCDPLSQPEVTHCGLLADEESCTRDAVCDWEYLGCSGTPAPCPTLDEEACTEQRGCTWQP